MGAESVGPYRIGERVGTTVWKAVDTRNNKTVALKILTKQLPKDPAKREALVREVRVAAALGHNFLVPIVEIAPVNDFLLMVMDFIDAQSISRRVNSTPLSRSDFFRLAYQLVDVVKYLHVKGLTHGNINTDSVLVTPNGQVKLGGLNMMNLRSGAIAAAYQQKSADARTVAYMSPEQIAGQNVEQRTDIYSTGVVLYEMSTGRLPYQATTAADFARLIVEGQPLSPKSVNPKIENAILAILGKCLFKDQYQRYKDAKLMLDDVTKADPEAAAFASKLTARGTTAVPTAAPDASTRQAILFVADVANYEKLAATNAEAASRAAARMQQILGEAVYLFDGQVLDPFAKRMVAELPKIESALEAGRKGEFDFSPEQQEGEQIPVRMLLHAGPVAKEGTASGEAVTRAEKILDELPPLQLFLTEEFVKRARGTARVRDAGARGGVKLFTIVPAEPKPEPEPEPEEVAQEVEAVEEEAVPRPVKMKKGGRGVLYGSVAAALLLVAAIAGFLLTRKKEAPAPQAVATSAPAPTPVAASNEKKIAIMPFTVEGTDANLATLANAMRLGSIEILRTIPNLRVADIGGSDIPTISGVVRTGTAGPEFVPTATGATPVPLTDVASGIRSVMGLVSQSAQVNVPLTESAEALNQYAIAVTSTAANDPPRADAAIKASTSADPQFLPAQLLAMRWFSSRGDDKGTLEAARQVVALDPGNLNAARMVARAGLASGELQPAFAAYNAILRSNAADIECLTNVARYAASVGDTTRFNGALARLKDLPAATVPVHPPDLLVASGRMAAAVDPYYEIESKVPNNPSLSLKIGKLAVLRQSGEIAELELKKLETSDPVYGYHLLKAYISAQKRNREETEQELTAAAAASVPGDDYWTSAAEIYAILGDTPKVIECLGKAAARKEPTATYILTHPLFAYLTNEPQFREISSSLSAQLEEIRGALAQVNV